MLKQSFSLYPPFDRYLNFEIKRIPKEYQNVLLGLTFLTFNCFFASIKFRGKKKISLNLNLNLNFNKLFSFYTYKFHPFLNNLINKKQSWSTTDWKIEVSSNCLILNFFESSFKLSSLVVYVIEFLHNNKTSLQTPNMMDDQLRGMRADESARVHNECQLSNCMPRCHLRFLDIWRSINRTRLFLPLWQGPCHIYLIS